MSTKAPKTAEEAIELYKDFENPEALAREEHPDLFGDPKPPEPPSGDEEKAIEEAIAKQDLEAEEEAKRAKEAAIAAEEEAKRAKEAKEAALAAKASASKPASDPAPVPAKEHPDAVRMRNDQRKAALDKIVRLTKSYTPDTPDEHIVGGTVNYRITVGDLRLLYGA